MGIFKIEGGIRLKVILSTRAKNEALQILCVVLLTQKSYNQQYSDIIDINKLITLLGNLE
jgi:UDP-N-acetylglucosamine enolpyruvyl transferase